MIKNRLKHIILRFTIILMLGFMLSSCIDNEDDVCGSTFTESEVNDYAIEANSFRIILKPGCKVTIKGVMEDTSPTVPDFFRFNPGDAQRVRVTVTWDESSLDIDAILIDEYDSQLANGWGTNDVERFEWVPDLPFYPRFLKLEVSAPGATATTTNYIITIEGE